MTDENTDTGTGTAEAEQTTRTPSAPSTEAPAPGGTGPASKIDPAGPTPAPEAEKNPPMPETEPPPPPPMAMKCPNGEGVREVEGNDTAATGTALDASYVFCGTFAGDADADHFTFTMPADATDFGWEATSSDGNYRFAITSEGVTADGDDALAPWFPGKPYTIKLTSTTKADYVFRLKIKRGN